MSLFYSIIRQNFVNKLYDYDNPDEVRRPWNDPIIPESINGKTEDPKVGKP
ncbi:MAG: hypothetical protein ACUVTD_01190 [Nitrososphaerales archaeon]